MSKKISEDQVEKLFEFCRDHYVPFYDLQVELVDHMASAIEEQWESQPELPFEKALGITFKKFGVWGFNKIKSQKQRELRRRFRRMLYKMFKDFYSWPKIVLTFLFTMVLFTIFRLVPNDFWVFGAILTLFLFASLYGMHNMKKQIVKVVEGKRFMLLDYMKQAGAYVFLLIQMPNVFLNVLGRPMGWFVEMGIWVTLLVSFVLVSFAFLLYLDSFILPKKVKENFLELYSEFVVA
jgi:hypothetical protein